MTAEDRIRWDEAFRQRLHKPYPAPDPLLLQFTPPAAPGSRCRALDLAAGLGQNGLWLAGQGYDTDVIDISRVALKRAYAEMTMRNLRNVNLLQVDVDDLQLEAEYYDVLCVFRYLKRRLFPLLKLSVKRGGRIIYETYNMRYLQEVPGFNTAYLLEVGELRSIFNDWHILYDEEIDHNARIVAIKPE